MGFKLSLFNVLKQHKMDGFSAPHMANSDYIEYMS